MKKTEPAKALTCFHCGDECKIDTVLSDNKPFCCHGCETVYKLLNDHQLNTYYTLEDKPGLKPNESDKKNRFDYLDDESIKSKILDFTDNKQSRITFFIPQMHCSSCLWLLENLYRINDAVLSSQVVFLEKKLTILYDETKISLSTLVSLLSSLGYEPTIKLDKLEMKEEKPNRKVSLKMAVAGFAFANIMLFSIPEYFASEGELSSEFKKLFSLLNIFLALPVLFYSASEYFSSAYFGLKQKIINMDLPISLGILILFSRSLYEIIALNQAGYFDSFAGLVFFLLIGKSFQKKTYDSLSFDRDYKSFFPLSVTKIENDTQTTIPITSLKIGDRLVVRSGELIPADAIFISGIGLIDYSFVTGESEPAQKYSGDKIYAGGRQKGGAIELEIIKEVSQSYLTRLWNEKVFKEEKQTYTNLSNKIAKHFTLAIIGIAFLTGGYWYYTDITVMFNAMTAVLIVACPCALALSTPFTLGTVLRYFGKNNFYLKNAQIVEILANVNTIVFDKTGTLTTSSGSKISYSGKKLNDYELRLIKSALSHSAHPLSVSIFNTFNENIKILQYTAFQETTGKGIETVIDNNKIKIGAPGWVHNNLESDSKNRKTRVTVAINDSVMGEFSLENNYRSGIDSTIENLKQDFNLALLSGDNDSEKENLKKIFGPKADIKFNCSPSNKLSYIENIKQNQMVLMLGDGLNDAGALAASDVGIAVTDDRALFTPASDAILKADNLNKLHKFIWLAKKSLTIIKLSFLISFIYNIIGISFAVAGLLSPLVSAILMPISSVTVVLFTTLASSLSARKAGLN